MTVAAARRESLSIDESPPPPPIIQHPKRKVRIEQHERNRSVATSPLPVNHASTSTSTLKTNIRPVSSGPSRRAKLRKDVLGRSSSSPGKRDLFTLVENGW
ncbi:unnamed protein product [Anisakis simplex]|uniref:Uncharacterized protein n=1 Tax=Anisakis simplex TaxID=6269 RepID=A0A0M3JAM1_ANISI|nr:unnamed protein product [Anisakis simplex]